MTTSNPLDWLITRAASGDREVLKDLLSHCRDDMVSRLRTRQHSNQAEDIVQDALAQSIQQLDQFEWHGWNAFQAWLWKFVENAHADRCKYHARACRDQRREVENMSPPGADGSHIGVLAGVAGSAETPSRDVRRWERHDRLRLAMRDELTNDQYLAIELRFFEFLPVEEVARHTGWTKSKVKMLCKGGLDRLREVVTEPMYPSAGS